jgi:hypothetical protein
VVLGFGFVPKSPSLMVSIARAVPREALSANVSETATPVKITVEGDGVVSHALVYQS